MSPARRISRSGLAAAAGAALGVGFWATMALTCDGACPVGRSPLPPAVLLAVVAGWSVFAGTRELVD